MKKIALYILILSSGTLLAGCGNKLPSSTTVEASYETIQLWHDGWSTIPETTTLKSWKNYKFAITPEKNGVGCMSTIKRAGTTPTDAKLVQAGKTLEFVINNAQPWEYEFVCNGMGMRQGSVIIE
jgi:uncharacterized cupredoxin-like copper-binding protein